MRITDKYVFFYGSGQCFSNWHRATFIDGNGVTYNCSEQYMMAKKAELFNDTTTYKLIMAEKNPREQKALGGIVKDFKKAIWNEQAKGIVYNGCYLKFTQNPKMLHELMYTGNTKLVEASPYDRIWGIGMGEYDKGVEDPENWKGTNWLGETLTLLRDDLRRAGITN